MSKKKRKTSKSRKRFAFLRSLKRSEILYKSKMLNEKFLPALNDHIVLENGYYMSVQCGYHSYSSPKRNLKNLKDYSNFEVACFDNKNNWIMVRLKEWEQDWATQYDGISIRAVEKLNSVQEGHMAVGHSCVLPYLSKESVELLYQYLKKQKRKFVITEKYTQPIYEEEID